jgi:REP element-mobilizing transposase RayT
MAPKFYNPWSEIAITQNRLPHWQQIGATCFVTWRLADSLPKDVLDSHFEDRKAWLACHPEPWDEATESDYHRRFTARIDEWLDQGEGSCLIRQPQLADLARQTLLHFDGERFMMVSFVIMPNHIHVLFTLNAAWTLEQVVHSWKRHSSREINRAIGESGPLWQKDYFDRLVRDSSHFSNCVRYIRRNPTKARLSTGDYVLYESELAQSIE